MKLSLKKSILAIMAGKGNYSCFFLIFYLSFSSTKNDQLRCKIIRLERDLRQKDVDLGKLQFEMKTTDVNELKIALKVLYFSVNLN